MLDSGYNLCLLTRKKPDLSSSLKKNDREKIKYISYDLTDPLLADISISDKIDGIIHIASIRGETNLSEEYYYNVNVEGTKNLLEMAGKNYISRFIYISTVGVLGTIPENLPASAQDTANPDSKYHRSKWQAEELVRNHRSHQLKTIVLRPTITYGTNDNGFIYRLINLVKDKKFFYSRTDIKIHLLYVDSLCSLILNILKNDIYDNRSYMVADECPTQLNDLVQLIALSLKNRPYSSYYRLPDSFFRMVDFLLKAAGKYQLLTSVKLISRDWYYDISDTVEELSYKPVNTLSTIQALITKYLEKK
jgi:nucleoside-diphosphate-sugar epimerase